MAVPQKELSYQATDQAPPVSPLKAVLIDWSRAVVVYPQLREFNQGLSPSRHLLPVLQPQEVVVMTHSRALSSCQLAQGKGNEVQCG